MMRSRRFMVPLLLSLLARPSPSLRERWRRTLLYARPLPPDACAPRSIADAVRYTPRLGGRGLADHLRDAGVETPNVVERDVVELAWSRPRGDDGGVLRGAVSALLRLWSVSCRTCGRTFSW